MHKIKKLTDVMLVGGFSIFIFVIIRIAEPTLDTHIYIAATMLWLANFINHPHFSFSYQIFLECWKSIKSTPPSTRYRWLLIGFVAPTILAIYLLIAAIFWSNDNPFPLAIAINLMGALVGWHYVKQGFGIAMLDAALTKTFWPSKIRKYLLINAYVCWLTAWVLLNITQTGAAYWGIFGLQIKPPAAIGYSAATLCFISTAFTTTHIWRTYQNWRLAGRSNIQVPWAGITAYYTTLYLWTIFFFADPTFALMIPFFHSVQYLTVVWKYKNNCLKIETIAQKKMMAVKFFITGILFGAMGFWGLPGLLEHIRTGELPNYSSPALAVACFWLFINVHHYLIDSALWKQDNPKIKKYLFHPPER